MRLQLIQASQDGMAARIPHLLILRVLEMVGRYSIAVVAVAVDFLEMVPQVPIVLATTHVALEEPHLKMVEVVAVEVTLVDSAAARLAIGITGLAVAVAADFQAAREVTTTEAVAEEVLITVGPRKQTLQLQTTQQDL
jgi:hypothetical protein